ncbi:MAG: leucine-rich repeat domain-containing protein [Muribaculaceae bacterium]|nr:leucine-rich repeat domain-containing protein [Muribaculaceae bacterium]
MFNLFNLFKTKKLEIKEKQYFDVSAFNHISSYVSMIDWYDPIFPDSNELDPYGLREPLSWEERERIERRKGPEAYNGGLLEFTVEEGITKIGRIAFGYNLNLKVIILPSTLERIEERAFWRCPKLQRIELPERIKYIGNHAFDYKLKELRIRAKIPPCITILGISKECKILVPIEGRELYLSSNKWKKYKDQLFFIE